MKSFRLIFWTTIILFIIGLLSYTFLLKLTEKILGRELVSLSVLSPFISLLSLGFLLAFCSICAGCLDWAYSKANFVSAPRSIFGLALFISVTSAIIGIGWNLLRIRLALNSFGNQLDKSVVPIENINYFSWGLGLTLVVDTILIAILLLISRQRQQQRSDNVSASNT